MLEWEEKEIQQRVSIHSGHRWPEKLHYLPWDVRTYERVSIHSGHRWPEKWGCPYPSPWSCMFQSTPAIDGRRNLSGDRRHLGQRVSIHSGHRWPEKSFFGRARLGVVAVSIHSGHRWPEKWSFAATLRTRWSFNPLRPSMAGEMAMYLFSRCTCCVFQSTPAIDGRRNFHFSRHGTVTTSFNPLRPSMAGEMHSQPHRHLR